MTTIPRTIALGLAATLVSACAAFDPNNILSRRAQAPAAVPVSPVPGPASPALGEAGRRAALDFVWSTVNERYYDPGFNGIDWGAARERWSPRVLNAPDDDAFWDLLDRMTGELRDSHTRVESPKHAAHRDRFESVGPGFSVLPLEGKLVVTGVNADSDAYWAGIRAGMALVEVAGESAQSAWDRAHAQSREGSTQSAKQRYAARRMLEGEPGTKMALTFERADGTPLTATLERKSVVRPPRVTHRVLPSGLGYIRLTNWSQNLQGAMIEAVEKLKDAPGLVIDLRGNPGGSALMVRNVAAQFFKDKVEFGRSLTRTGKPITLAFDWIELVKLKQELDGTGVYGGPVAVLVNAASGSGSELFAGLLQSQGRATIVGQTTCGCLLAFMGYANVPGGARLAYSEVGFVLPDGRRIEGKGVLPDRPVPVTVADLVADRDRALEAAQAHLKSAPARQPDGAKSAGGMRP